MKTAKASQGISSRRVLVAALVLTFLLTGTVFAQPTAEQLLAVQQELSAAQGLIVGGKVANGREKLKAVQATAPAHFPQKWTFVNTLATAAQAAEQNQIDSAAANLTVLIGLAKESDQEAAVLYVSQRVLRVLTKANRIAQAQALAASIEAKFVTDRQLPYNHRSMTTLWILAKDAAKAEAHLRQAALFAKTENDWNAWRWTASQFLSVFQKTDEKLAAYERLIVLATSPESKPAREAVTNGLVSEAIGLVMRQDSDAADRILQVVKDRVPEGCETGRRARAAMLMVSARNASAAGNYAAALESLRQAYDVAKDTKGTECVEICSVGVSLASEALKADDKKTAAAVAEFLAGGPATHERIQAAGWTQRRGTAAAITTSSTMPR